MFANKVVDQDNDRMKASIARSTAFEMSSGSWDVEAACARHDPEMFFPIKEMERGVPTQLAHKAIVICENECKVREQCLSYALDHGEKLGIWGGMTSKQRADLERSRNR